MVRRQKLWLVVCGAWWAFGLGFAALFFSVIHP